ncbi:MAG: FCD domain-containing protein [Sphingomonadales bacterium]
MMRNEKISESISRAIVAQVTDQGFSAGDVLESEADMMSRYKVSRGSLREALRILEVLGFILMKPGPKGGPILQSPDSRQFSAMAALFYQRIGARYSDLLEIRLILEPEAAALAAARRTPEQVKILQDYLEKSGRASLDDDRQFRAVGQGFHDLIADMAGNGILSLLVHSSYDLFAGKSTGFLYPNEERRCISDIHNKIAYAVIEGYEDKARSLMRDHMRDYYDQARSRFPEMMEEPVRW